MPEGLPFSHHPRRTRHLLAMRPDLSSAIPFLKFMTAAEQILVSILSLIDYAETKGDECLILSAQSALKEARKELGCEAHYLNNYLTEKFGS